MFFLKSYNFFLKFQIHRYPPRNLRVCLGSSLQRAFVHLCARARLCQALSFFRFFFSSRNSSPAFSSCLFICYLLQRPFSTSFQPLEIPQSLTYLSRTVFCSPSSRASQLWFSRISWFSPGCLISINTQRRFNSQSIIQNSRLSLDVGTFSTTNIPLMRCELFQSVLHLLSLIMEPGRMTNFCGGKHWDVWFSLCILFWNVFFLLFLLDHH